MRVIARGADAFASVFKKLLPGGRAFTFPKDSPPLKLIAGLAETPARLERIAVEFLERELFPPTSVTLLPEWERVLGLPGKCAARAETLEDRQAAVAAKLTARGGLSPAYYKQVAAALGYTIEITEFPPLRYGLTPLDGTRFYAVPGVVFQWVVRVPDPRVTWLRYGLGRLSVDHQATIARAEDLECRLQELKPDHTLLLFFYEGG